MSRYVSKKHGLTLGSSNVFFYKGEDGSMNYFNAIVSTRSFDFEQPNSVNCFIRTPAQQVIFKYRACKPGEKFDEYGRDMIGQIIVDPSQWAKSWCDTNAPGWGFPSGNKPSYRAPFFFQKRSHAVAFCKAIDSMLSGITSTSLYSEY